MPNVHILPPEIISKIAAGEVIERPASVIKELVENALDAHTKSIEISLKQAGKSSIYIKDTGIGIEPEDIEKVFQRHSTSKIHNINDLFAIRSLGFRGEALYSISAIADVTLRSKTKTNDTGWEIHLRGNEKMKLHPASMAEGTEMEVKELFFNTPARKKFLKTDTTELRQILNLFMPYTLLHPEKHFSLSHYNNTIIELSPEKNHTSRIEKALNLKSEHILETKRDFPEENISMRLILGDINIQRPSKDLQFIFVNGRPVQNRAISFHINQVYKLIFPPNLNPFFSIYLHIPPEDIDVNIHPTKREVKIKKESVITSILRALCEQTLMSHGKAKEMHSSLFSYNKMPPSQDKIISESHEKKYGDLREEEILFSQGEIPFSRQQDDLKNKLSGAHYIGTFLKKYLFFESGSSLLIIDQHAAQERVTYERLIHQISSGHIEIQRLLTPFVIQLSPQERLTWEKSKDMLEKVGLETTPWDRDDIALHTHPQLIKKPEIALRNILSGEETQRYDTDTAARHACRNSVMAGDKMAPEEAQYLRSKLVESTDPFTCPHGRPTVIEIKEKTLEKEFLRG